MPTITMPDVGLRDGRRAAFRAERALDAAGDRIDAAGDRLGSAGERAVETAVRAVARAMRDVPEIDLPRLDVSPADVGRTLGRARVATARAIDPRPSPWPLVAGAAIVGMVVGWVLASSPITGPGIRRTIDDARDRVARWRVGPPPSWEDLADDEGEAPELLLDPGDPARWSDRDGDPDVVGVGPGRSEGTLGAGATG